MIFYYFFVYVVKTKYISMNHEKQEKRKRWKNRTFERFVRIINSVFFVLFLITIQCIVVEISIVFVQNILPEYYFVMARYCVLLSTFFYACARVAARSYIGHTNTDLYHKNGDKYRARVIFNVVSGIVLFFFALCLLYIKIIF